MHTEALKYHAMGHMYSSGEEIQPGDHILYHGEAGYIEFIAEAGHPETGWYVEQYGGGYMLVAEGFGHVFESEPGEDLEFVSRANPTSPA